MDQQTNEIHDHLMATLQLDAACVSREAIRVWLCDCGRVHLETRDCRLSFEPQEFVARLRSSK